MKRKTKIEIFKDDAGEWRWRVRARNGEIIADSAEGYVNRSDCLRMAEQTFPGLMVVER